MSTVTLSASETPISDPLSVDRTLEGQKRLARKPDLVLVMGSLAENQLVLSACSHAEIIRPIHARPESDRPFSAWAASRTTMTSSGTEAKTSRV